MRCNGGNGANGGIRGSIDAMSDDRVYAWCIGCYAARPAYPRTCGIDGTCAATPAMTAFLCDTCRDVPTAAAAAAAADQANDGIGSTIVAKSCPTCTVTTEKTSGCDHMTCPCGAHWCFECGEVSTYADIYKHMNTAHGGMGYVYEENDDDEEEDDDQY